MACWCRIRYRYVLVSESYPDPTFLIRIRVHGDRITVSFEPGAWPIFGRRRRVLFDWLAAFKSETLHRMKMVRELECPSAPGYRFRRTWRETFIYESFCKLRCASEFGQTGKHARMTWSSLYFLLKARERGDDDDFYWCLASMGTWLAAVFFLYHLNVWS